MLSKRSDVKVYTSSLVAELDWMLTLDSPKANELKVLMWPIVYWAIPVMLPLIEAVVVDEVTFGYSGLAYGLVFCC